MDDIDKINNVTQKEAALKKAGVTRHKYMRVIADALVATKFGKSDKPNEHGQYDIVEKPDTVRQQWGAEMAAKFFSDLKELTPIVVPIEAPETNKIKVDPIDLEERIRQITHATITTIEAERIKNG
jgi:1,2-phenylacetyl-CoA epoxidase catalytic subunit